ncbi:MAG: alcohol dehydrogenase [Pirellulaceae bacterium]|nr:MAG: alcohol dehydrogenase [Pirellulaceae bacterium]
MTRRYWEFRCPPQILFGRGAVEALPSVVQARGARRIFLITDSVLQECGHVERVAQALRSAGCSVEVFAAGKPEPCTRLAQDAADQAADFQPDAWAALGGGSNIDLAKLACTLTTYPAEPNSYFGFNTISGPLPTFIAIPTTAGTGSEVSHAAVVKHAVTGQKGGIVSEYLRPDVACVDPSLTDSCPRQLRAVAGFDALTHAVEALLAAPFHRFDASADRPLAYQGAHPLGTMFAERAIALIGSSFRRALTDVDDQQACDDMALAATYAGLAFSSCGVSLVHALEYWLGSKYACPHGAGNALLLPAVLRYYLPDATEQVARVGALLGVGSTTPSSTSRQAAEATIDYIEELRREAGLPTRLRELGATADELPGLARAAGSLHHLVQLAPRPTSRKDLLSILETCL